MTAAENIKDRLERQRAHLDTIDREVLPGLWAMQSGYVQGLEHALAEIDIAARYNAMGYLVD